MRFDYIEMTSNEKVNLDFKDVIPSSPFFNKKDFLKLRQSLHFFLESISVKDIEFSNADLQENLKQELKYKLSCKLVRELEGDLNKSHFYYLKYNNNDNICKNFEVLIVYELSLNKLSKINYITFGIDSDYFETYLNVGLNLGRLNIHQVNTIDTILYNIIKKEEHYSNITMFYDDVI